MHLNRFVREFIILIILMIGIRCYADTRIRVAVLDSGINFNNSNRYYLCTEGHYDATGTGLADREGHGTNVAGLIAQGINPKTHCIVMIKFFNTYEHVSNYRAYETMVDAWNHLRDMNPAYVNMSLSGTEYWQEEYNTIKALLAGGTKISVAAGNENINFDILGCYIFPACYHFQGNFHVVGAKDLDHSNRGGPIKYFEDGLNKRAWGITKTGTSQSSAIHMAKWLTQDK